jgi:hypothetical protein
MGENNDDEDEDGDDEGDAIAPPAPVLAAVPEVIIEEAPMENGPQELDELDDMGDPDEDPNDGRSGVDEWFPQDGSNDRD